MIFHGEIWVVFNNLRSMWSPDESHRWLSKISEYSFSSFVNPPIGSTTVLAAHDHFFSGKAMQKTWIKRSTSAKVWDTTWDQRFLPLSSQKEMNRHGRSMNHPFYRDPSWQIMFSIPPAQWPSHVPWSIYIFGPWVTFYPLDVTCRSTFQPIPSGNLT